MQALKIIKDEQIDYRPRHYSYNFGNKKGKLAQYDKRALGIYSVTEEEIAEATWEQHKKYLNRSLPGGG